MSSLHLEIHYAADLAERSRPVVDACRALHDLGFGTAARVLRYERDRGAIDVDLRAPHAVHRVVVEQGCDRGPVFGELERDSPPSRARRFGTVMVRGALSRTWLGVRFDEYVPAMPIGHQWLFSNSISLTLDRARVGASTASEWMAELFARLAADPDVLWGAAWHEDEFRASNLHHDQSGTWALGRDVRRSLPGLFWLNAFGPPYADVIGRDVLRSAPAKVDDVGSSVVVALHPSPGDWATKPAAQRRGAVLDHIGRRYFFDRAAPDRATVTADFGLPELPPTNAFQVVTSDGTTFTVVPTLDE